MSLSKVEREAIELERISMEPEVNRRIVVAHAPKINTPVNEVTLRRAPVWALSVEMRGAEGWNTRTHGFTVVGDPGQGSRSGAAYYSISGDEKRGAVTIDMNFIAQLARRGALPMRRRAGDPVCEAVAQIEGKTYRSREAFYCDYAQARRQRDPATPDDTLVAEFKEIVRLLPEGCLELWLREPNGPEPRGRLGERLPQDHQEHKPNLAERDLRTFEQLGGPDEVTGNDFASLSAAYKQSGNTIKLPAANIRCLSAADPLALLHAKRQNYLERLYVDELHGRFGSGWKSTVRESLFDEAFTQHTGVSISSHLKEKRQNNLACLAEQPSQEERLRAAFSRTAVYQRFPPMSEHAGNCNTGAAELLRNAGVREEDILSPGEYNWGLHHSYGSWRPVKTEAAEPAAPSPDIDTRSARDGPVDVSELLRVEHPGRQK